MTYNNYATRFAFIDARFGIVVHHDHSWLEKCGAVGRHLPTVAVNQPVFPFAWKG